MLTEMMLVMFCYVENAGSRARDASCHCLLDPCTVWPTGKWNVTNIQAKAGLADSLEVPWHVEHCQPNSKPWQDE